MHSFSQPTYLKRLSFNSFTVYTYPADSIMHLLSFSASSVGHSFIEIKTTRGNTKIIKLDLQGNIKWEIIGTWLSSHWNEWIAGMHATPDGGVIYIRNIVDQSSSNSYINKLDSSGILEWATVVPALPTPFGVAQESFDISILPDGYACLASDSIFVFDLNGVLKKTYNFGGPGKLTTFSNGDMFVNGQSSVRARFDSSGTIRYTIPGVVVSYDTLIYALTTDSIHLLDGITGNYTSSAYFPPLGSNKILMMKDGGRASYNSNRINRYDHSGNLLWIKNIKLPVFGINLIGEQSDGSILTGGTFRSYGAYVHDLSSFITTIDTLGQSILDSTSQVWPGDANDDSLIEFTDIIYVALAQGSVGLNRIDSTMQNNIQLPVGDIAVDFNGEFGTGVNHKQCDVYPDGIIDSMDIQYSGLFGTGSPPTTTPWRLKKLPNEEPETNILLPYFSCIPDRDTVAIGDTVRFHYLLGNNGILVDSIFGLAFVMSYGPNGTNNLAWPFQNVAMSSDLGASTNLRSGFFCCGFSPINFFIARKDLQNAYLVKDTIAYTDLVITNSLSTNFSLTMILDKFKAITADGNPIAFQFMTSPLHIRTFNTTVDETNQESILIYPVPAKEFLIVDNLPSKQLEISVYNYAGQNIMAMESNSSTKIEVDIKKFSSGIYFIQVRENGNLISRQKFVKE
ncbi:MAG: T9SS type A sorting domain-containing protein [Bacteroidia bacterium]|nr:T9SS type A sorting domain-containing protein [Bacteroidia bacterium]